MPPTTNLSSDDGQLAPVSSSRETGGATALCDESRDANTETLLVEPPLAVLPVPIWKSASDIFLASLALIALLPVFLLVAIYIKVVSSGPVFFRHQRFGFGEQPFRVWKFRTMSTSTDPKAHAEYVNSLVNSDQPLAKTQQNQLIPLGGLIRDLGIDELPQLFNVLAGEMSLIGPRPDVFEPSQLSNRQRSRYQVLPGITGLWQISGKNDTTFDEMIELDVRYVETRGAFGDLRILVLTPLRILGQFLPEKR